MYSTNISNNSISLICWLRLKTKLIAYPTFLSLLEYIDIKKDPSAVINPDNQWGFKLGDILTSGTLAGIISGYSVFIISGNPLFKIAFSEKIFNKPGKDLSSPFFHKKNYLLK